MFTCCPLLGKARSVLHDLILLCSADRSVLIQLQFQSGGNYNENEQLMTQFSFLVLIINLCVLLHSNSQKPLQAQALTVAIARGCDHRLSDWDEVKAL